MAALGEGWEMDYDGTANRWFYRYKPTNHIQYSFPKDGDEYPWEYVGDVAGKVDLAPEEKLVSQQQVKRRSTLGDSSSKQASGAKRRERAVSNVSSEQDDGGSPFWLQPDALMYMGPGAYTDISPLQEEDEERGGGSGAADEGEDAAEVSPAKASISPVTSAEATPLAHNSQPATATPEVESAVIVESSDYVPVDTVAEQPPEIPLLDSKEVPRDPLGFVAELSSELTPQCADEINPAPVELPSNEMMMETSGPVLSYTNAFDLAPVELPTDPVPRRRSNLVEEKSLRSQTTLQQERQQQRAQRAAQEAPKRPSKPVHQSSTSQSSSSAVNASNTSPERTPGKYQPYNPAARRALGDATVNRYSVADIRRLEPASDNKRHSLAGPDPSHVRPNDIPAALLPPHVPPKRPLDAADTGRQAGMSVDLAHFPSVLKPARGRPVIRAQSPPQSQGSSPARSYQAYKPYRDLQRDIEETVQLFSKTGYGQGTTTSSEASHSDRPQVSRTSTLPADLPALPFMGVRPHLPASAASAPVTVQSLQSRQTPLDESRSGIAVGREEDLGLPAGHSVPLPRSSPDLPPPLSLSRKSSAPRASEPTAISSFHAPATTEADMPPDRVKPATSGTVIVFAEVAASSGSEGDSARGAVGETESHAEHVGGAPQPVPPAISSMPSPASGEAERSEKAEHSSQAVEQPPSGFSVMAVPEPSISPAPQVAMLTQPPVVSPPEVSDPSVSLTSLSVESSPDVPPAVQSTMITSPVPGAKSPSEPLPNQAETTATDQQPESSASDIGLQGTESSGASQLGLAASGNVQEPHHVVLGGHPAVQVQHESPAEPDTTLPAGQTEQSEIPSPESASAIQSGSKGCLPSFSVPGHGYDTQQVTSAQPSANAGAPDRVPTTFPNNIPSIPAATAVIAGVSQDSSSADQASLSHDASHAPTIGLGPSPLACSSPPLSNVKQMESSTAPAYTTPAGHHLLGSHPANSPSHASPPRPSALVKEHQAPQVAQTEGRGAGPSGQQFPQAAQRSMSQPLQTTVPVQLHMQPAGLMTAMPVMSSVQGQEAAAPNPQKMPQRALSQPAISPSDQTHHPGIPGTVPYPGMRGTAPAAVYPPPAMPPGMLLQGVPSGMLPPQQYAFHPGMPPQLQHASLQGTQHSPMGPHFMMQPSQTMPAAAYVMLNQQPKEERSRLFRSESVKTTGNAASQPNKLQKASHRPMPLGFEPPQQLHHPNQPVPHPPFAPAPHPNIPPHAMMHRPTKQPQPGQHNFQQQLEKLKTLPQSWKTNNGNGSQQAPPPVNKFQVPNRPPNHNQSVIPPPDVRQAIKSQEQRLTQTNSGQTVQGGQQHGQGLGQGLGAQEGKAGPASSGPPPPPPAAAAAGGAAGNKNVGGQWGNASAYDGADWGDDGDF